jgi:hypothetical protein
MGTFFRGAGQRSVPQKKLYFFNKATRDAPKETWSCHLTEGRTKGLISLL